jgi:hypothetical protein
MENPLLPLAPLVEQTETEPAKESVAPQERTGIMETVRQWVKNDHDMNLLKQELTRRREIHRRLTAKLVEVMRENEMEEGDIRYVQETKKKTISKKGLIPILFRFYKGDTAKAAELTQYIYDNRETVVQEKIKPVIAKKEKSSSTIVSGGV